jgi:hypothetical protein
VSQIELPVRALFEAPTISQLAVRVEPSVIGCSDLEELARNLAEVKSLSEEDTGHMPPDELSGVKS